MSVNVGVWLGAGRDRFVAFFAAARRRCADEVFAGERFFLLMGFRVVTVIIMLLRFVDRQ